MKITIYELLGLIKNGKPPKKIKFKNDDWYWGYDTYIPYSFLDNTPDVQISTSLFHRYRIDYCLNDEVEIQEEKEIPEKLEEFDIQGLEVSGYSMTQAEYLLEDGIKENRETINSILDYLKSKGE